MIINLLEIVVDDAVTGIGDREYLSPLPADYSISPAYPNPFNPVVRTILTLPRPDYARVVIYYIEGQMVETVSDGFLMTGDHQITWRAKNETGGINFLHVRTKSGWHASAKLLYVK